MITKNRILFILGVAIVFFPLLGFPSSYEFFFTIVSGLMVVIFAFLYARDKRMTDLHDDHKKEVVTEGFSENRPYESFSHQFRSSDVQSPKISNFSVPQPQVQPQTVSSREPIIDTKPKTLGQTPAFKSSYVRMEPQLGRHPRFQTESSSRSSAEPVRNEFVRVRSTRTPTGYF